MVDGQVRHITSPRLQSHLDQFNRAIWVCPLANRDTHQHGLLKNQIHSTKNEKVQSATKGIFQKFPMHFSKDNKLPTIPYDVWPVDARKIASAIDAIDAMGDIHLMRDSYAFRGEWKLCNVYKMFPDAKKKVRNVKLRMKPRQGGSTKYVPTVDVIVKKHAEDLIVLVPIEEREESI